MRAPLLHIGLHRTGSTWIQKSVFNGEDGRPPLAVKERIQLNDRIVAPRDEDFDPVRVREWLLEQTKDIEHPTVLSSERFSGNPHSGWFDANRNLDRLHAVLPEARVLLVVREQRSLIQSLWLQYTRIGGTANLRQYLRAPSPGDFRAPVFDPAFLKFHHFVESLDRRFGPEQVLVLPFELLKEDPQGYLRLIAEHGGFELDPPRQIRPRYASPRHIDAHVRRWTNRLFNQSTLHLSPLLPSKFGGRAGSSLGRLAGTIAGRRIDSRLKRAAGRIIEKQPFDWEGMAESNRTLSIRMNMDLTRHGHLQPEC